MKNFKIVFYKSELGELVKLREFFKEAEAVSDLVADPPEEFMEMLGSFFPVHGWAELETRSSTVYVIFAPREEPILDYEEEEFHDWLETITPSDFLKKPSGQEGV